MKSLYFILAIMLLFLTSACASGATSSNSQGELVEPYRVALDEIMLNDKALNENMEYISLVLNEDVPLNDSDKQEIEEYLQKKYNVKIYNYTYEQLIDEKLCEMDGTKLKGILLTIGKPMQSDNKNEMNIEISKYRANEGAIALGMIVAYQEGQWKVVDYSTMRQS